MENLVLISISKNEIQTIFQDALKNVFLENSTFQSSKTPQPESDKPLSVIETAKFLDLAVPTIYGLIHKKQIPHIKRGGRVYFIKSDLLLWLIEGKQKTSAEIEIEAEQHLLNLKKRRA